MPDLPISGLPAAGPLAGTELTVAEQAGTTKSVLMSDIKVFVVPNLQSVLGIGNNTGATDILFDNGTAARLVLFGASKELVASPVTSVEASYLSGATSNIQNQLNALQTGLYWKAACRVASVANVNVSSAPSTIDGVTLAVTNRILLKDQSSNLQNGIWVFNGTGSALTRAIDFDNNTDHIGGAVANVEEGTVNADKAFVCTSNEPVVVGTDPIIFVTFGGSSVPSLTATQVAFGDGSNLMTSSADLTFASNALMVTGTYASLALNANTGTNPFISGAVNSSIYSYIGTAGSGGAFISGSGVGDFCFRSEGKNILFSCDAGTTEHMALIAGTLKYRNQYSASATPAIAAGPALGTGPTVSISGTNDAGIITITPGTSPTTGALFTVTFSNSFAFPNGCAVSIMGYDANGTSAVNASYSQGGTTSFTMYAAAALPAGTYTLNYIIKGY